MSQVLLYTVHTSSFINTIKHETCGMKLNSNVMCATVDAVDNKT